MKQAQRLEPIYDLRPNESREFYRGDIAVASDDGHVRGEGSVHFDWHAGFRVKASGEGADVDWPNSPLRLLLSGRRELEAWPLISAIRPPRGAWKIQGHCEPQVHGDRDAALDHLLFHVANCPKSTFGTANDPSFRVHAVSPGWELTLDEVPDYDERASEIRLSRGGAVTHIGRIRRTYGRPFSWHEGTAPLEVVRFLLSFAAGHRVAPLFAVGIAPDGRHVVEEWGGYRRDAFGGVINWCTNLVRGEAIQAPWTPALTRWTNDEEQRLLTVALELYLDAQKGRNVETRLVSAQAGLELLSWHLLARLDRRDPAYIDQKEAAWRLRRLVERAEVDTGVPETLDAVIGTWPRRDGPSVVCHLRNQVTHPTDVALLIQLDGHAKHEVLRLATWYLELAMLRLLDYHGNYLNQTLPLPIFEGRGEPVPWADQSGDKHTKP